MHVIGNPAANHDGSACHQRRRRQLVVGIWHIAQPGFEINLAIFAEVLAELAGVRIDCDQAGIDGIGQQTTLARSAGSNGCCYGRGAAISRLGYGIGRVEISQATASLPDGCLSIDNVFPQLFTGVGIQSDQVVVRRADKHLVADLQRGHLVFGTVAIADGHVTGLVGPGRNQFGHVAAIDLVQHSEAAATFVITVVRPVFLGLGRVNPGQTRAVTGGRDRSVGLEHCPGATGDGHNQYCTQCVATVTAQAIGLAQRRVNQCHHQAQHGQGEQP